jgi:hypothetical protein
MVEPALVHFLYLAGFKLEHTLFGAYWEKDSAEYVITRDGKPVKRGDYKRGEIKFSPELAETVRQFCATHTVADETVTAHVVRYEPSAVKAVTVDQAGLIVAKNAIIKRNDNPAELDKLAKMVEFQYSATNELTVENSDFVEKVASFYANL